MKQHQNWYLLRKVNREIIKLFCVCAKFAYAKAVCVYVCVYDLSGWKEIPYGNFFKGQNITYSPNVWDDILL
jgi:hypothetical protein